MSDRTNLLYGERDVQRELDPPQRESVGEEFYRSPYRRDYARIIHSPAFRRLQGKTQVFPGDESDFFRNRLTHSLEVAQIGKSIAIRLNNTHQFFQENPINEDIVEVAGLAHDLGHPPFGHNGEAALDVCMKAIGGFEGNAQTFRIVTRLEKKDTSKYQPYGVSIKGEDCRLGLNFSYRTLASIIKYDQVIPPIRGKKDKLTKGIYESDQQTLRRVKEAVEPKYSTNGNFKTIECSIMDIADDIAYSTYDLEDTFKANFLTTLGILSIDDLSVFERVSRKVTESVKRRIDEDDVYRTLVEIFRDIFTIDDDSREMSLSDHGAVAYVAAYSAMTSKQIASNGYHRTDFTADLVSQFISGVEVAENKDAPSMSSVFLNPETQIKVETLKHLTFEATIMAPRMRISEQRGYEIICKMFEKLNSKEGYLLLPEDYRELYQRFQEVAERKRLICDFIAGMTDRYAVEFFGRLFSESPQSIFKPF